MRYKILSLSLAVIIIDQLSKILVKSFMQLNESIPILPKIFHLTYINNTGSLFGLFQGMNSYFVWLSLIIIGSILYCWERIEKKEAVFFSLIIGAIVGNLIDRVIYGHVIDFIDFRIWPVFNIADAVISACVVLLIFFLLRKK